MMKTGTWRTLLTRLEAEDLLDEKAHRQIRDSVAASSEDRESQWYVHGVVMASAWMAALLIIMSLLEFDFMRDDRLTVITGIVLITLATLARRKIDSRFVMQLALAFSIAGQFFVLTGMMATPTDDPSRGWASLLAVEIILIVVYPDLMHCFLSTVIAVLAAAALLYSLEILNTVHILVAFLVIGSGWIWIEESQYVQKKYVKLLEPLSYGFVTGLLSVLVFSILEESFVLSTWWISTIILTIGMLYAADRIVQTHHRPGLHRTRVLLWIATIILAATTLPAPGIMAALFVLLLGFHRGNRILQVIAFGFLVVFVVTFYYNLDLTLLAKSITLMSSGLVLLLLRHVIIRFFGGDMNVSEIP